MAPIFTRSCGRSLLPPQLLAVNLCLTAAPMVRHHFDVNFQAQKTGFTPLMEARRSTGRSVESSGVMTPDAIPERGGMRFAWSCFGLSALLSSLNMVEDPCQPQKKSATLPLGHRHPKEKSARFLNSCPTRRTGHSCPTHLWLLPTVPTPQATRFGNLFGVELLLELRADVNLQSVRGARAPHARGRCGKQGVARCGGTREGATWHRGLWGLEGVEPGGKIATVLNWLKLCLLKSTVHPAGKQQETQKQNERNRTTQIEITNEEDKIKARSKAHGVKSVNHTF